MQNVAKLHKICGLKKFPVPLLDTVEWEVAVGVEKTILAAKGGAKAILATIHLAFQVAMVAVGLVWGLLL